MAKKQGKYAVKVGREFPVEVAKSSDITITMTTAPKKEGMSFKAMVVAIVGILVFGAVSAATVYGVATQDYSVLKDLAESVKVFLEFAAKSLK